MKIEITNNFKFEEEFLDISNKSNFILVSYYWGKGVQNKGSIFKYTYDQQAQNMIERCRKLNINYYFVYIKEFESLSYQIALGYKFDFIKYCLDKFNNIKNIVFIDTDMKILQYPILLEKEADVFFVNWNTINFECFNILQLELPGAILGFGNNLIGRKVLNTITRIMDKKYAEDKTLSGYFTRQFFNVFCRCVWLPETYLFMFQEHIYEPGKGYTKLASYKKELKNHDLKLSDLVISHEDYETGELHDVYEKRVGYERYPPMTDTYMGEKLRCMVSKFDLYPQMSNNKKQIKQYEPMLDMFMDKDIANVYYINIKKELKNINKNLNYVNENYIYKYETESKILIVHTLDNENISRYEKLMKKYEEKEYSYILLNNNMDIPTILLLLMEKYTNKNILYMGDIDDYNIKFIELYENNEWIDFSCYNYIDKCSDYRILYTKTMYPMYFKNEELVKNFILIWSTYNKESFYDKNIEHKSLEYCLNKTISVNEMRCQWLYTKTIKKYFSKKFIQKIHKRKYNTPKNINKLRDRLTQCGIKPKRNENGYLRTHFKNSKYVDINYEYENFLFDLE